MDHEQALEIAREVVEGLSVGDALGEAFSYRFYNVRELLDRVDDLAIGSLQYTDDTELALAIFETLSLMRSTDEEVVSWAYGRHFMAHPDRGYGKMARRVLEDIAAGTPWKKVSPTVFGSGSFGNGGAMRVAPLGAYFSDDLERAAAMAARSARVTHFHPEGIAGAIAVAVAAGAAAANRDVASEISADRVRAAVLDHTPEGRTRQGIEEAFAQDYTETPMAVAKRVGNGAEISAQDTVPFCLWNACRCLNEFEEAFASTVEVGGDCDTNAAIVCGVVTAFTGSSAIPRTWRERREPLKFLST